jgi:hypothetical protein
VDGAKVKRWIAGFEAVARVDREECQRRGPDPAWSIRIAQSMIEAARQSRSWPVSESPERRAEAAAACEIWNRLRRRLGR